MALSSLPAKALRLLLLATTVQIVSAACYYPSGDQAPNDTPCRDDTSNSVCCGQGYACLSNGICKATGDELQKKGATEYVRGSCTDKKWRSSSCPLFCMEPGVDNVSGGEGIGKCSNTTKDMYWCINIDQDQVDCDQEQNVLYFPGTPSAIKTIGVSPTSSTTSFTSFTSSASSTSQASTSVVEAATTGIQDVPTSRATDSENQTKSSGSKGPIIGGAVGAAGAVLLLGGLGIWLFLRRKKQKELAQDSSSSTVPKSNVDSGNLYQPVPVTQDAIHEAPTSWYGQPMSQQPSEVSSIPPPQELSANMEDRR